MSRSHWVSCLIVSTFLLAPPSFAQGEPGPARLLADLHPGSFLSFDFPQRFSGFTRVGNRSVFTRNENEFLLALWATDGTVEGTRSLGVIGLYFDSESAVPFGSTAGLAFYGVGYDEWVIWRTDGTPAGTFPVTSGLKPPGGSREALGSVSGGRLFFNACSTDRGCELWSSDGSVKGTKPVGEIVPGPESGGIREIKAIDGRAFLIADAPGGGGGTALWLADTQGLKRLRDTPGASGLSVQLAQGNGRVFFFAQDASDGGFEVWTSDGTAAGTRPVTGFAPQDPFPRKGFLALFSGRVWFVADNGVHGLELWSASAQPGSLRRLSNFPDPAMSFTDVGKAGQRIVFVAARPGGARKIWSSRGDFRSTVPLAGCAGGCPTLISPLASLPPNRFVLYGSNKKGPGFWVTDGTRAGTRLLRRSKPQHDSVLVAEAGGRVLFELVDESQLGEIWITNGTAAGTFLVTRGDRYDFAAGTANGAIVFAGAGDAPEDWPASEVLWRSDGTPAGSRALTQAQIPRSSAPRLLTPFRDGLLVQTCPHVADWERELWFVDATDIPTSESTRLMRRGVDSCRVFNPVILEEAAVFLYNHFTEDLWGTDGTLQGTQILVPESGGPSEPFRFGDEAAFRRQSELWVTDGTPAGTRKHLGPPPPEGTFLAGRYWFFRDSRPWVGDGTPAGTYPLTPAAGHTSGSPLFVEANGRVYFPFGEIVGGEPGPIEIWSTDGTPAGTGPAITAASGAVLPARLRVADDRLYFAAPRIGDPRGWILPWASDGTDAGTVLLADVDLRGADMATIFTELNGRVFFAASQPRRGNELWSTEGTPEGTSRLLEIAPGLLSSYPRELTVWNGRLYFRARDGVHGMELWTSDGTAEGTRLFQDIAPGASWSTPAHLTPTEEALYFSADDGAHGEEVWVLRR